MEMVFLHTTQIPAAVVTGSIKKHIMVKQKLLGEKIFFLTFAQSCCAFGYLHIHN